VIVKVGHHGNVNSEIEADLSVAVPAGVYTATITLTATII
jgi:hypothetical protein